MRHRWALVLLLGACTSREKGLYGIDDGIGMTDSPRTPIAVGATHTFLFYDLCTPGIDSFCEYDHLQSIGSTTVTGSFELVSTTKGIEVRATSVGNGMMRTSITQTDNEVKSFTRTASALVADRVMASCSPTPMQTGPAYVTAGSVLVNRMQGQEIYTLHLELFSGTQSLLSDGLYPFAAPGFTFDDTRIVASATPGPVTLTSTVDPTFGFPFEVVSLAQIDKLELVKVPPSTEIPYYGLKIVPTVAGNEMCRPPWEAITMTVGPDETCSLKQFLPPSTQLVQWHQSGTCHVEATITGTSLVATTDLVR